MVGDPPVTTGDPPGARWQMTAALLQSILVAGLCTVLAVLLRRPDLLILGVPFVVIVAWSLATRPTGRPEVHTSLSRRRLREGEGATWEVTVTGAHDGDQVIAVMERPPGIVTAPDLGAVLVVPDADGTAHAPIAWEARRWGQRTVGNGTVTVMSPWAAFRFGPVIQQGQPTHTAPAPESFAVSAPAPHPEGLVGLNRGRRHGDGSEFADIRPFQRGDRLRRIHWPVSARTGELHVRTMYAEQDTEVLLLIDAILDVGVSGGLGGRPSSLDLTVRAAGALATALLARGERVGLHAFGMRVPVRLPAGMGARQQRRIIDSLGEVQPALGIAGSRGLFAQVHAGAGALVLMLSPLVTRDAEAQVARLAQRGLTVVVVDCLPADVLIEGSEDPLTAAAWRVRRLEREVEILRLRERGVPVVPWRGPGSLDPVLRQLARRPAPRIVIR